MLLYSVQGGLNMKEQVHSITDEALYTPPLVIIELNQIRVNLQKAPPVRALGSLALRTPGLWRKKNVPPSWKQL